MYAVFLYYYKFLLPGLRHKMKVCLRTKKEVARLLKVLALVLATRQTFCHGRGPEPRPFLARRHIASATDTAIFPPKICAKDVRQPLRHTRGEGQAHRYPLQTSQGAPAKDELCLALSLRNGDLVEILAHVDVHDYEAPRLDDADGVLEPSVRESLANPLNLLVAKRPQAPRS